jgi:hypothetical protein
VDSKCSSRPPDAARPGAFPLDGPPGELPEWREEPVRSAPMNVRVHTKLGRVS